MQILLDKLKALSDANRFRIAMMLLCRPLCVCELLEVLDIAGGTLSNHLKVLKNAGLISQRKDGRWIEYCVRDEESRRFLLDLESRTADRSQIDKDREHIGRITRAVCSASYKDR